MKILNSNIRALLSATVLPVMFALPAAGIAADTGHEQTTPLRDNTAGRQISKEAHDAAAATQAALKALTDNQPKQALAALQVASGNLHLLLSRDPGLALAPLDIKIQVLEGPTNLKDIKVIKHDLEEMISDNRFQDARPILDSLVDEVRITVVSLPMGSYPAAIDRAAPLIDAGKLAEAKQELIRVLDTVVYEQDVTPLAVIRAEDKLNEAFRIEHAEDLSSQATRSKIAELVDSANDDLNLAEALGYGDKQEYKLLYQAMDGLEHAIGSSGFAGEWHKIKAALGQLKNRIVHPAG